MDFILTWLNEGFFHIISFSAIDHLLFILVTVLPYKISEVKKLLWVITSFTLAHSISLALAFLNIISINNQLTELLIAFTILFTCIENIYFKNLTNYRVLITCLFGLIHGLGFSSTLSQLFMGMKLNLFETLLPFNIGIECGQIVVIACLFISGFLFSKLKWVNKTITVLFISWFAAFISIYWIWDRAILLTH